MENFEAVETTIGENKTENKKNTKSSKWTVREVVELCSLLIVWVSCIYFDVSDSEPFLFGRVWDSHIFQMFLMLVLAIHYFSQTIKMAASRKRTVSLILDVVLALACAASFSYDIYSDIKNTTDTERITLSDGNEIILKEYIEQKKYTFINVYQANGIIAKKIGRISEISFPNKCLLQDKYSYEYDEENKKLTVICEHGSESLEEQNGTGFWEGNFTLK